jgi:hypothetical protein
VGRGRDNVRGAAGDAPTALVVVVVAGLVLGALLLRPDGSLRRGGGPVHAGWFAPLLAVCWVAGGLALYARHRRRVGFGARLTPVEQRLATAVRATLLAATVAVPFLVIGLHRLGPDFRNRVDRGPIVAYHPRHGTGSPPARGGGMSPQVVDLMLAVAVVVLLAAVVYAYRRLRAEWVPAPKKPTTGPDDAQRLADAVESGRRALLDGADARAAVIACYAAMEASLGASGVARQATDSPQDLLERATASGLPTEGSVTALTDLFREARYSTHPMGDAQRAQAAAALTDIADLLGTRGTAPAAAGAAS